MDRIGELLNRTASSMQTLASDLPNAPTGRRAYGSQRRMSPAEKARNIAQSIALRIDEGRAWGWEDYGITPDTEAHARARQALRALTGLATL